jgi:phage baseplate assembly protein W
MAFGEKRINPLDTRPGVGIGVSIPFNNLGVFKSTYTTKEATKVNLINYFLTNTGERYLNPTFGGNLRNFIFQQITDNNIEFLKEDIQSQLREIFPQVNVESIEILTSPDFNQVNIILKYSILNANNTDTLDISFT